MSLKTVPNLVFVRVNTYGYHDEPDIEFNDPREGDEIFGYDEFKELIAECKQYGIECKNLEAHLPEFEHEHSIWKRMLPPENIPAAM